MSIFGTVISQQYGKCSKILNPFQLKYSKPVLSDHSKRIPKLVFKTDHRLMQVKSIAECSKGSILQYFRPSLRYHLSLTSLFCLFFRPLKTGFIVLVFRAEINKIIVRKANREDPVQTASSEAV